LLRFLSGELGLLLFFCRFGLFDVGYDLNDFCFVLLRSIHADLELICVQRASPLRDTTCFQMKSDLLGAFGQFLHSLTAKRQFACDVEELRISA
jgi:hypothetical protein